MTTRSRNLISKAISGHGLIFTLAITIRLLYLLSYEGSPPFIIPVVDAQEYHNMASDYSHSNLPEQFAFRPPAYPLLLGLVYMLFGQGLIVPRLIQIITGAFCCVLVQKIGIKLFGKFLGFWAGVLASFSGLMIYFDLELLPTSTVILFNLLFIYAMLSTKEKSNSAIWAGLWLAASALARPVALTFFPFAILWLWFYTRSSGKVIKFAVVGVAPLIISLVLHISAGAGPVLVSAQGGINFYIGSHPESDGMTAHLPGYSTGWNWDQIRSKAEVSMGQSLTAAQIDRFYWRKGIKSVKQDPIHAIKATWRKARLYWNRIEISSNRDLYYHGDTFSIVGWLMWLGFPLILPLAMAGIATGFRDRKLQLLILFIAVQFLTAIPFFVNARFRHPLLPIMIVLAISGIKPLASLFKRNASRKGKYAGLIGLFTGVMLLFAADSGIDTNRNDYGLFTDGTLYERLGKPDIARNYYLEALEINPRATFVNFNLAEMERANGNLEHAITYYRNEIENQPSYAKAWNNLGVTLMELGESERALECYEHAIKLRPDMRETANNIAKIWGLRALHAVEDDKWSLSLRMIANARRYNPNNPIYHTLELEARVQLHDSVGVKEELRSILAQYPSFQPALELLKEIATGN